MDTENKKHKMSLYSPTVFLFLGHTPTEPKAETVD